MRSTTETRACCALGMATALAKQSEVSVLHGGLTMKVLEQEAAWQHGYGVDEVDGCADADLEVLCCPLFLCGNLRN